MGGLFGSAPKPVAPAPAPEDDAAARERRERIEALMRRRRGREATVATSARGLLEAADWAPRRKSLLGE